MFWETKPGARAGIVAGLAAALTLTTGLDAARAQLDQSAQSQQNLVQASEQTGEQSFDIGAGPVADALNEFAKKTNSQLIYNAQLAQNQTTNGVSGTYSPGQALSQLLQGTNLASTVNDDSSVEIYYVTGTIGLDTVVVDGRKRGLEDVQNIPGSVFVTDGDEIEIEGTIGIDGVLDNVPNTAFETLSNGDTQITIRGQSTRNGNTDSGIGFYVDGAYAFVQGDEHVSALFDISQVNVLLGPQGTLYGRNAIGGAINIETANPNTDAYEAELNSELGNFNTNKMNGFINLAFSENFAIRLAGIHYERDGFFFNDTLNQKENGVEINGVRLKTLVRPTENIEVVLGVEQIDESFPGRSGSRASQIDQLITFEPIIGSKNTETTRYMSDVKADVSDNVQFRSITGYREYKAVDFGSDIVTTVLGNTQTTTFDVDQLTQEFRLNSNPDAPGNLKWLIGGNIFKDDAFKDEATVLGGLAGGLAFLNGATTHRIVDNATIDVYSGFSEATYSMFQKKLHATGSLRYSSEEKAFQISNDYEGTALQIATLAGALGAEGVFRNETEKFERLNPGVSLAYDWTNNLMTYVKYATAYKSGGINFQPLVPADKLSFGPEDVESYETGIKSSWFNNKLTVNANIFYQDHKDIQAALNPPGLPAGAPAFLPGGADRYFDNLGDGTTKGAELSLRAMPVKWFTVESSYGYLHPTFDDGTVTESGDVSGNIVPFVPEHTISLSGEVRKDVGASKEAYLRATYYGTRGGYHGAANTFKLDNKNTVNLFGGVEGRRISAGFYVNNLFDNAYWEETATAISAAPGVGEPVGERNAPRTFGGRLTIKLGG